MDWTHYIYTLYVAMSGVKLGTTTVIFYFKDKLGAGADWAYGQRGKFPVGPRANKLKAKYFELHFKSYKIHPQDDL